MALQTTEPIETAQGFIVEGAYWRWVYLNIDVANMRILVTILGYRDAQAFAEGKTPVATHPSIVITGQDFMILANKVDGAKPQGLSAGIYEYLIENVPFFADATQVV